MALPPRARRDLPGAGLQVGDLRYAGYTLAVTLASVAFTPLPLLGANVLQALIFLVSHVLAVVVIARDVDLLPVIFAGALFTGWVRIRSGSIVEPWLIHAALNVTTCLSVAVRTAR